MRFKGIAPDCSFTLEAAEKALGTELHPLLTRIDSRTFTETHYLAEGKNCIITTLKLFGGGAGQPIGVEQNVLGTWIFDRLLTRVQNMKQASSPF